MAKISARGATEVARVKVTASYNGCDGEVVTAPVILVACSDGRVLQRIGGEYGSGYKVIGKISKVENRTTEFLNRIAVHKGFEVSVTV